MPSTRSATRRAVHATAGQDDGAGVKRKAQSGQTAASKRGKVTAEDDKQLTLDNHVVTSGGDTSPDNADGTNGEASADQHSRETGKEAGKDDPGQRLPDIKHETKASDAGAEREQQVPASILEKGLIYFLARPRVNTEDPGDVNELQRTFIVLRPIPHGAKIKDGPIADSSNNRLIALPKKVLPTSGKDRFLAFVEKPHCSMQELKESFFRGHEYETATLGTRHQPPVTPIGEGVYVLTRTGRDSHLAYILTIPVELGEVQRDMGLRKKASFLLSVKNPKTPAPAGASLPSGPDFPAEILDEFNGRRWLPVKPEHFGYESAQVLLIGESNPDHALEPARDDQRSNKETPLDELLKLEHEDEERVQELKGDEAIHEDLKVSLDEILEMKTTW